ncbi:MAG TPA: SMC-Scp complex subunit ScpB [Thermomicrobiales bacterium]|nr:SMC-Scp complex subunit ScpB [Thermomicrobiales bacterium]
MTSRSPHRQEPQGYHAKQAAAVQAALPGSEEESPLSDADLSALLEALLLVAPGPTTAEELARGAGVERDRVEAALVQVEQTDTRGWVVQRHGDRVQLATAPRFALQVRRFLGLEREARLSAAALETLAIVAYQQPVTKAEIEGVRGVDCSGVLTTLLSRGLIESVGRLPAPGNPFQYGTTPDFLMHFGLRSLADLPPIGQVEGRDGRAVLEAVATAALVEQETKADGN